MFLANDLKFTFIADLKPSEIAERAERFASVSLISIDDIAKASEIKGNGPVGEDQKATL